jgi:hypothetical protein
LSQINNVITTTFRAREGGLIAQLGSYAQGFGTIYNRISDNSRMSDRLNSQWRAFGTTIRYAIAGQALFGLTRMLSSLKDINVQLAEMAALTTPGTGGSSFSSAQVTRLGQSLQRTAIDTLTPLSQVNDAAINFLSTVQQVQPGNALADMLTQIGQAATIAQTPILDLTQAVTTQQIAFGRPVNKQTIGQATRMWQELILQAPGGPSASSTIAQAMPSLASMFQLGRGKDVPPNVAQAQMYGLTLGALRTGMPASTAMRGLTYLLQSIAQPTGKARGALAGIGITPQFIEQHGINAALMKLLQTVTHTGNTKALAQIPDDTLDTMDQTGANLPGIPASEMIKLRTMIPRIHGIRAAIILASQLRHQGSVMSVGEDIQTMLDVQNENSSQTKALATAWQNYRKRARLQEASNAINTMSLQVAQTFEPILGFVAQHAVTPLAGAMQHHRTATKIGVGAAALGIGGLMFRRLLGFGGGNRIAQIEAAQAAISGSSVLGGSPQNPLYVIVVGQLFSSGPKLPTTPGGIIKDAESAAKTGGILGIAKAAFGFAKRGGKGIYGTIAGGTASIEEALSMKAGSLAKIAKFGGPAAVASTIFDYFYNAQNAGTANEGIFPQVKKLFPGLTAIESSKRGMFQGHAEVFMTIDINQGGKITKKRVHIPLSMAYQGGRVPSAGGKAGKTTRSNG